MSGAQVTTPGPAPRWWWTRRKSRFASRRDRGRRRRRPPGSDREQVHQLVDRHRLEAAHVAREGLERLHAAPRQHLGERRLELLLQHWDALGAALAVPDREVDRDAV